MKPTAVDFIQYHFSMDEEFEKLFKEAKEMEKEQIKNAFIEGEHQQGFEGEAENYYNQTYGEL